MCRLIERVFSHGKREYSLDPRSSCNSLRQTRTRAYCLAGVTVVSRIDNTSDQRTQDALNEVLQFIDAKSGEAQHVMQILESRVNRVRRVLKSDRMPDYNFNHLQQFGYNPDLLKSMCTASYSNLKDQVAQFDQSTIKASRELEITRRNVQSTAASYYLKTPDGVAKSLYSVNLAPLEGFREEIEDTILSIVRQIECNASNACLEKLQWSLPQEDGEFCLQLQQMGQWKQGVPSGSSMDKAYTAPLDFDVAEDFDPWR